MLLQIVVKFTSLRDDFTPPMVGAGRAFRTESLSVAE